MEEIEQEEGSELNSNIRKYIMILCIIREKIITSFVFLFYLIVEGVTLFRRSLLYLILVESNFAMVAFSLGWDLSFVLLVENRGIVRLELRSRVLLLRLDTVVEDIEVFVKGRWELELLGLGHCSAVEESLVFLELISE